MTIAQDIQKPVLPGIIELYIFDMVAIGGPVLYFTPNVSPNGVGNVSFGGQVYNPLPVGGTGWEVSIDGAPPRPSMKISNITRFIQPFLTQYKDCVGTKVTRMITTETYLDSGATPDGTAVLSNQVYYVNQLASQTKYEVEFKLASPLDNPNLKLPKEQVLRNKFPGAGLFRK